MGEWTTKSLADVVELRRGFDLPHRERVDGPFPVLSAGITAGWHTEGPVNGPGFVVGRATNLGVPTWSDTAFWPLNTTLYAADFKGNNPKFLYHLFESIDLSGFDSGSVQPMLNRNYIAGVKVRVPDLVTQRSIAEVLGALDDKIAANDRVITTADELAKSLFRRSVDDSAEGEVVTLGELVDIGAIALGDGYRTKKAEHAADGYRIIRAGDVASGRLQLRGPDFVSKDYVSKIGPKVVTPGDIVLTTKGTVGRVAVVPEMTEEAVYSPQLCYFRVIDREQVDPGFLSGWFFSEDLQQQAAVRMYKSDMAPYINLQDIRSLQVPLPAMTRQREIGEQQRGLMGLRHRLSAESERLAATRDELLPLLMSGKLRVNDVGTANPA